MISENRKAKEHNLVKEPDISMMDFHPDNEQTPGDESEPTHKPFAFKAMGCLDSSLCIDFNHRMKVRSTKTA